jgi:hypothetical protein
MAIDGPRPPGLIHVSAVVAVDPLAALLPAADRWTARTAFQSAVPLLAAEWPGIWWWLFRGMRAHCILIAVIVLHVAAAFILPPLLGLNRSYELTFGNTFLWLTILGAAIFLIAYMLVVIVVVRPTQPVRYIWNELSGRCLTPERLSMMLPVLLFIPLLVSAFSFFKIAIPDLQPFAWDPLLAEMDRMLHGGHHPWEWLQPVLGHPYVTALINGAYHLWFGVIYAVLLWQMVDLRRPKLRMQYLLTFTLLWILIGNVAAAVFSSAGPVYYGRVTGLVDPFAPLMAYLHHADEVVSVPALAVQDLLWRVYSTGSAFAGGGISAMPSMHLASTFCCVLLGLATRRWLGAVFGVFALLILVGSVHLGWHYAVDGYVAIIATCAIWRAVGWLLDRAIVTRLLWGEGRWPSDAVETRMNPETPSPSLGANS